MTPTQRAAALRLADVLDLCPMGAVDHEVSALLRELASEPVQEPVAWMMTPNKLSHPNLMRSVQFDKPTMRVDWELTPLYAHPPQQRRPLSDAFVSQVVRSVQPNLSATCKAWAEQFDECKYWLDAAHGIGCKP